MVKKVIEFADSFELAQDLIDLAYESMETSVIGSYEFIEDLLKSIIKLDDENEFTLKDISLCDSEINSYTDKYILEIGTNYDIWVYPIVIEGKYLITGTDILFIEPDVDEEVYSNIEYDQLIVCVMDEEYDCGGDCENCHLHKEKDSTEVTRNGNVETHESPSSITQSWSSPDGNAYFSRSFYSSIEDEMEKVKAEWRRFAQMF